MQARMFTARSGSQLAFVDNAETDRIPVVFSNSICCTKEMWDSQASALDSQFRVIRYDLRGHGESPSNPLECSIDTLAEELLELLDHLRVKKPVFIGSSISGLVGMSIATRYADLLKGLVLSNTSSRMPPRDRWDKRIEEARAGKVSELTLSSLKRWIPKSFQEEHPELCLKHFTNALMVDGFSYARLCEALRDADFSGAVSKISVPTMVTGSTEDVSPLESAQALAQSIPHSQFTAIHSSGHLPSIDQPAQYSNALLGFLESIL